MKLTLLLVPMLIALACTRSDEAIMADQVPCTEDTVSMRFNGLLRGENYYIQTHLDSTATDGTIDGIVTVSINIEVLWKPYENLSELYEVLIFDEVPLEKTTINLAEISRRDMPYDYHGLYGHVILEDILGNVYEPLPQVESTLTVSHVDTVKRRIQGTFEAHFQLRRPAGQAYPFPEEVHFTEGWFCAGY